jgi:hypothetical protein
MCHYKIQSLTLAATLGYLLCSNDFSCHACWPFRLSEALPTGSSTSQAPNKGELEELVQLIGQRVGRSLERQGLLEQATTTAWMQEVERSRSQSRERLATLTN